MAFISTFRKALQNLVMVIPNQRNRTASLLLCGPEADPANAGHITCPPAGGSAGRQCVCRGRNRHGYSKLFFTTIFIVALLLLSGQRSVVTAQQASGQPAIKIVEYGDYQCPACRSYHIFLEKIKNEYPGQITVEYEHFPILTHPYAELAARAAEAARNQGKFEEMHNTLFANQQEWTQTDARLMIKGYARDLRLDMDKFMEDWHSLEVYERVDRDKERGKRLNVRETPTLFIKGEKIPLPMNYQQLKNYIEKKLAMAAR